MIDLSQLEPSSFDALIARMSPGTPDVWIECARVLKPGAYALILPIGPVPADVSIDVRRAGFEMRDTILIAAGGVRHGLLFRKPIEEKTLVAQVVATGTGGINIDACRVKHSSKADFAAHKAMVDALKAKGGSLGNSWKNTSDLSNANEVSTAGRWPGNLVLVHARECRRVGETKMNAPVINRFEDGMKPFGNGAGHAYTSTQTGDAEGKETVAIYECTPGCLVERLNVCSGSLKGRANTKPSLGGGGAFGHPKMEHPFVTYGDSGGASRFFSQFENEAELKVWLRTLVLPRGGALLDLDQELESDGASEPDCTS